MPPSHPNEKHPESIKNIAWHIVLEALKALGLLEVGTGDLKRRFRNLTTGAMTTVYTPRLVEGWLGEDAVRRLATDLGVEPIDLVIEAGLAQKRWIEGAVESEEQERKQVPAGTPPYPH